LRNFGQAARPSGGGGNGGGGGGGRVRARSARRQDGGTAVFAPLKPPLRAHCERPDRSGDRSGRSPAPIECLASSGARDKAASLEGCAPRRMAALAARPSIGATQLAAAAAAAAPSSHVSALRGRRPNDSISWFC